jgi:hypothetical protein
MKQGKARLAAPFNELAAWIGDYWDVNVLNVTYDPRNELHAPRIRIVLEHEAERQKFRDGFNFDRRKQQTIAAKFREIVREDSSPYDTDGLFVVFSAFAPLACEEADSKISEVEIDALMKRIGNPDLWTISRLFGHVTFMFYTDAQAREYAAQGKQSEYAKKYFEILKPYDEFGYLRSDSFTVAFDSKQNFDDKFHGSWFNYYR